MEVVRIKYATMLKLSALAFLILLFAWYHSGRHPDIVVDHMKISVQDRKLKLQNNDGQILLEGQLGLQVSGKSEHRSCESPTPSCIQWKDTAELDVSSLASRNPDVKCYRIKWQSLSADYKPMDCFKMKGAYWYGGAELFNQQWPINSVDIPLQQYVSMDYLANEEAHNKYGSLVEPYWLTSNGVAIFVDSNDTPLQASINQNGIGQFCLASGIDGSSIPRHKDMTHLELSYVICQGKNARDIHSYMAEHYIDHPNELPDERVLKCPIWSTWARYKTNVNQSNVLQYAAEIEKYGFSHSQIEIDDMYTTAYGDFDFDTKKFPDAAGMVKDLHARGFRVTSWITPFANLDSKAFYEGEKHGYWVKDSSGRAPGLVHWWQGLGAALDTTNPAAVKWFIDQLEQVRQTIGIDSFKFDAGEMSHLPTFLGTHTSLENPNEYTQHYANIVEHFGKMAEMRAGYRTQKHPFFMRMLDKDSIWDMDNGLQTMIPTALMMSITGYHYILPDMIGGNGFETDARLSTTAIPDKELFIRWVQLSAYLPSLQFSFTPWQYDEEVIQISKAMVKEHEERVFPAFMRAAKEMLKKGTPIIRPIWWMDPKDSDALSNESEFLVGDEILVAPIIVKGARSRDIYLPKGRWKDDLGTTELAGGTWIKDYVIGLNQIATFTYLGE